MYGSGFFQTKKSADSLNPFFSFLILMARGGLDFITGNPFFMLAIFCCATKAAAEMPEVGSTQNRRFDILLDPRDGLTSRVCIRFHDGEIYLGYDIANLYGDKTPLESSQDIAEKSGICHVPHEDSNDWVNVVDCFEKMLTVEPREQAKLHREEGTVIVPTVAPVSHEECVDDVERFSSRRWNI